MKSALKWLKKCFIPHEHNEFRPHFLRHESFLLFFSLIIVIELGFLVQIFVIFDKTGFLASVLPGILTSITNEERLANNVSPLTPNDLLNRAAQLKAEDMAAKGYFAHVSPEGITPWYWLDQVGYQYSYAGENLAVNFFESEDVSEAWMNSPSHRANIVKENYREIGIGVAKGIFEGRSTVFVAQFFGTPAIAAPATTTPEPSLEEPKPEVTPAPKPAPTEVVVAPIETATIEPSTIEVLGEETTGIKTLEKTTEKIVQESQKQSEVNQVRLSLEKNLASPRHSVGYTYLVIVFLVAIALMFVIFVRSEIRSHHPAMIARGAGLIAVIAILSFVNIRLLNIKPVIPLSDLGASVTNILLR